MRLLDERFDAFSEEDVMGIMLALLLGLVPWVIGVITIGGWVVALFS